MTDSISMKTSREQALDLIQNRYYRGTDTNDPELCASALSDDVEWSHISVWNPSELSEGVDRLMGRQEVFDFLSTILDRVYVAGLVHTVREFVYDEDEQRGAFLAVTTSTKDDRAESYMVWFSVEQGLLNRYLMRPV